MLNVTAARFHLSVTVLSFLFEFLVWHIYFHFVQVLKSFLMGKLSIIPDAIGEGTMPFYVLVYFIALSALI